MSILELNLGLEVPILADVLLPSVFGAGRVDEVAVIASNLFTCRAGVNFKIIGQAANLENVIGIMALVAKPRIVEPYAAAPYVALSRYVMVIRCAAHVVDSEAAAVFAVFPVIDALVIA